MVVFTSSEEPSSSALQAACRSMYICVFVLVVERGAVDGGANQADLVCTLCIGCCIQLMMRSDGLLQSNCIMNGCWVCGCSQEQTTCSRERMI